MFTFIKDAFRELNHVVWPTPKETRKYMNYTISVIIAMGIFLAILGWAFRDALLITRHAVNPSSNMPIVMPEHTDATYGDVANQLEALGFSGAETLLSGATINISSGTLDEGTSEEVLPSIPNTPSEALSTDINTPLELPTQDTPSVEGESTPPVPPVEIPEN